ncbi:MAG: hypothetical protein OJI70_16530 [Zavarzinia sp.]|nr:hypothetical protein [Zavarzinia sp.]
MVPHGQIEPHAEILVQPKPGQRLFKIMKIEHLIKSIKYGYLHFNRVDSYADFPMADHHDGAELLLDRPGNQAIKFEKNPDFTLSKYYSQSRGRTYACCFSLENSQFIWENCGGGVGKDQVGLEFDFEKLKRRLNISLSDAALMCENIQCHQIFSINYGEISYVDRENCCSNADRLPYPIEYAYFKDNAYAPERELRVTLSAMGIGKFALADGREMGFPSNLQFEFDFREAISDGTIVQVWTGQATDEASLGEDLGRLRIGRAR